MEYIFIAIILASAYIIYQIFRNTGIKNSISFMETFNLTEMPIVTFLSGDVKVNFLLDTGSSHSFLAQNASSLITGTEAVCDMSVTSAQGTEDMTCKIIETVLTYKNKDYDVKLVVNKSLDISFNDLKAQKGIILHGILGSDFLDRYSYIMDFGKYIAYPNK